MLFGIFLAMFSIPEILFGSLFNATTSIIGLPLHSVYYNLSFFNDYPYITFLIIISEIISISGLWYLNLKINQGSNIKRIFFRYTLGGRRYFISATFIPKFRSEWNKLP